VHHEERGVRGERGRRLRQAESLEPGLGRLYVDLHLEHVRAQPAQQIVLGRGADRDDGVGVAVAGGRQDRLEAAHARASQRHAFRSGSLAEQLEHAHRVLDRAGAELAVRAAVAPGVVADRRHSVRHGQPREVEVALLGGAGAVQDQDAGIGGLIGQEERVGEAVVLADLGHGHNQRRLCPGG
jgi:hypothetical protein